MARYAAFLRGINLGRVNRVPMAGLRTMLGDLGYTDVKTLLQSGNAVFTTSAKAAKVERDVESAIRKELGLEVPCVVRTAAELRKIVEADPFGGVATDPARYFVVFLSAPLDDDALNGIDPAAYEPEQFHVKGRELYLWLPGGSHASKLAAAVSKKHTKLVATMRNWNTVTKVLDLA